MEDIRKGVCPLCRHSEIIESVPSDFGASGEFAHLEEYRQAITHHGRLRNLPASPKKPIAPLLRYTCRRCGYCQTFAEAPETIPIGEDFRTRLIEGPEQGG